MQNIETFKAFLVDMKNQNINSKVLKDKCSRKLCSVLLNF